MEAAPAAGIAAAPAVVGNRIYRNCSLLLLDGKPEYVNWHPDPLRNREWCQRVGVERSGLLSFSVPRPGTSSDWVFVAGAHIIMHDIGCRMWKDRRAQIHTERNS